MQYPASPAQLFEPATPVRGWGLRTPKKSTDPEGAIRIAVVFLGVRNPHPRTGVAGDLRLRCT